MFGGLVLDDDYVLENKYLLVIDNFPIQNGIMVKWCSLKFAKTQTVRPSRTGWCVNDTTHDWLVDNDIDYQILYFGNSSKNKTPFGQVYDPRFKNCWVLNIFSENFDSIILAKMKFS